jgi:hypothetical protein
MGEILLSFLVDARVSKNAHIMVRYWIIRIYVDKQASMVKNNYIIHSIDFLAAIEPSLVIWILPRFLDFN